VKRYALAATLSLCFCVFPGNAARAAAIELAPGQPVQAGGMSAAATGRIDPAVVPAMTSELPEPEVFAMMAIGLILIGYRVSRDSSEKFK
jgi:hypothetical protein